MPVKFPTKVVEVTDVRPARVVVVCPRLIRVVPIVMLLFVRALFGILTNRAPDPLKVPAVSTLVEGLYATVPPALNRLKPVTLSTNNIG